MPSGSIDDVVRDLKGLIIRLEEPKVRAVREAALDTIGLYKRRIFVDGRATSASRIGRYSTRPTYVSIAAQKRRTGSQIKNGRLTPKGKNGRVKFKNGRYLKTRYFPDGYKGFRDAVGRQSSYVDFNLSGELERSIQVGSSGGRTVIGFLKDSERDKAEKLEKKFQRDVFTFSDEEVEKAFDVMEAALLKAIDRIL